LQCLSKSHFLVFLLPLYSLQCLIKDRCDVAFIIDPDVVNVISMSRVPVCRRGEYSFELVSEGCIGREVIHNITLHELIVKEHSGEVKCLSVFTLNP
jgi:hypothetical protein